MNPCLGKMLIRIAWWASLYTNSPAMNLSPVSHTLHRKTSLVIILLLRNAIIVQRTCYDVIATPWQWVQSKKSTDLIGHSKFLPLRQLDGCSVTRHFLSLWRMWLAWIYSIVVGIWKPISYIPVCVCVCVCVQWGWANGKYLKQTFT